MGHVLIHSLLDSLKVLPILLIMYILIEVIEVKTAGRFFQSKIIKNKWAPLIGASVGIIPQCGFSVVATDLYTKKHFSIATLLAIFVATSDEALPILLSDVNNIKYVLPLIGIKFLLALIIGYGTLLLLKIFNIKEDLDSELPINNITGHDHCHGHNKENEEVEEHIHEDNIIKENIENESSDEKNIQDSVVETGCCGHKIGEDKKFKFKDFILHPLLHSLKLFIFIFIFNVILGSLIHFIGEETIKEFMNKGKYIQPLVVPLIGLIPNCAASVFITQLFTEAGLTFGSCIAGLCCNAGLGMAVLIKQNKNKLSTLYIILGLYLFSVASGMIITAIESLIV